MTLVNGVPQYNQHLVPVPPFSVKDPGNWLASGTCVATATGSVLAYWDHRGYENLFPADAQRDWKNTEVMRDYIYDMQLEPYHINAAWFGIPFINDHATQVKEYITDKGYDFDVKKHDPSEWEVLKNEIGNDRPALAYVEAARGDGSRGEHLVPVIGYDEDAEGKKTYYFYKNWDEDESVIKSAEWIERNDFQAIYDIPLVPDVPAWSVSAFWTIKPKPEPKPEPGPRPEPPASETAQDLGGDEPSGDGTTGNEKIAFSDLPPPSAPPPSTEESAPEPGIVQIHPGAPPTGSAPEPGSGPEPVDVALKDLPPPPPVPAPPSAPPTVPTPENVQNLGGNPPTGSAPEPGSGPEPVDVALKDLPPPPPVPAPPSAPPPSAEESAPEPPASDTVQDLGGEKPSGDSTTDEEKFAFDDLPPPPDIPPPPPPSFSPDEIQDLNDDEPTSPERELAEDRAPEPPASETVQDLGGNEPTAPDDILLG